MRVTRAIIGCAARIAAIRVVVDDEIALLPHVRDDAIELLRGIDAVDEPHVDPRARRRRNDRAALTADTAARLERVDVERRLVVAQLEALRRILAAR